MESKKFACLDGIRGIAALLVMVRHTPLFWGSLNVSQRHSYLAVDLFFVLSGFVISHAYARKLRQGGISAQRFMLIRWIRLYPLYFLAALMSFLVAAKQASMGAESSGDASYQLVWMLLVTLLFLPSRSPLEANLFPLNLPFWSLFYEMLMNAVYAVTQRWLTDRVLMLALGISAIGLSAFAAYHGGMDMGFTWGSRSLAAGALRSFFGIFLGLLLHRMYEKRVFHRWMRGGSSLPIIATAAILLLPVTGTLDWVIDLLAVLLVFPVCVYAGACAAVEPGVGRAFEILGIISYPIYLLHVPASKMATAFWMPSLAGQGPLVGLVFAALLALACLAIDGFYDRPVRRWLADLVSRIRPNTRVARIG